MQALIDAILPGINQRLTNEFGAGSEPPIYAPTARDRPPDNAIAPYLWIRLGNDLPPPFGTLPEYKITEVLIDVMARGSIERERLDSCVAFLEDHAISGYLYRFGRRVALTEPIALRYQRSFNVYHAERRVAV